MIQKIFAIYDSGADYYCAPFTMRAQGEAIREFIDTAKRPDSQIGQHPADFTLWEIGVYNNSNAAVEMYDNKINLGTALELRNRNAPETSA